MPENQQSKELKEKSLSSSEQQTPITITPAPNSSPSRKSIRRGAIVQGVQSRLEASVNPITVHTQQAQNDSKENLLPEAKEKKQERGGVIDTNSGSLCKTLATGSLIEDQPVDPGGISFRITNNSSSE